MYSFIWLFIYTTLRPLYKWFLRKTTGLCELQRIAYGEVSGAPRILATERSLNLSRSPQIKQLVKHLNDVADNQRFVGANLTSLIGPSITTVLAVKKINPKVHYPFVQRFGTSVKHIWGYRQLVADVEDLRKTAYNSEDSWHEDMLKELWTLLMPDEELEGRITKQWQDIGFQGDDPKTDFRGMGILGLANLHYFAKKYNAPASHVFSHSLHPVYGYAFAIVGINLTSMAWQLLKNGDAKTYVYNTQLPPSMRLFHEFYSYLFYEFDRYWIECKPKNVMEFSNIKERFENQIRQSLQDPTTVLRINVSVETV